jgi:hypothetical protein
VLVVARYEKDREDKRLADEAERLEKEKEEREKAFLKERLEALRNGNERCSYSFVLAQPDKEKLFPSPQICEPPDEEEKEPTRTLRSYGVLPETWEELRRELATAKSSTPRKKRRGNRSQLVSMTA